MVKDYTDDKMVWVFDLMVSACDKLLAEVMFNEMGSKHPQFIGCIERKSL